MEIILTETGRNQLITFLKLASRQQSQVVVTVKETEIYLEYIPAEHVNYVNFKLENHKHMEMTNVEQQLYNKPFELSSKDLLKILTNIKKQDLLIHTQTDDKGTLLGFNFVIKTANTEEVEKEIRIGIQSLEQQIPKELKMQYPEDSKVLFDIKIETLLEKLTELKEYEYEAINLTTDSNTKTLELVCEHLNSRKKMRMILHNDVDFFNAILPDGTSTFALSYLVTLLVAGPAYHTVRLQYAEGNPLLMHYYDNDEDINSNLFIMIAPRKTD